MRRRTWSIIAVRVLFGALFVVSGANKVVQFLPAPPMSGPAASFVTGLVATGYFLPLLGWIEVASGVLLISGQFVPLTLVVLAPIVVHIAFFHALLAPNLTIVVMVVGSELLLAWHYRGAFEALLQRHTTYTRSSEAQANT